jgi:hypothetical protein
MTANQRFDTWAAGLNLKHFAPHELRFLGGSHYLPTGRAAGKNTLPPRALWENIAPVAKAADLARAELGSAMRILSAYRSPEYNLAVGGARFSRHLQFDALDLAPVNGQVATLHRILVRLRRAGIFTGGIGRYPSFVHIDARGHNVDF